MSRPDPFMTGTNPITGDPMGAVTADDRKRMARNFNRQQCMDALAMPRLQTTVRAVVARRLRVLQAEADAQELQA